MCRILKFADMFINKINILLYFFDNFKKRVNIRIVEKHELLLLFNCIANTSIKNEKKFEIKANYILFKI